MVAQSYGKFLVERGSHREAAIGEWYLSPSEMNEDASNGALLGQFSCSVGVWLSHWRAIKRRETGG